MHAADAGEHEAPEKSARASAQHRQEDVAASLRAVVRLVTARPDPVDTVGALRLTKGIFVQSLWRESSAKRNQVSGYSWRA